MLSRHTCGSSWRVRLVHIISRSMKRSWWGVYSPLWWRCCSHSDNVALSKQLSKYVRSTRDRNDAILYGVSGMRSTQGLLRLSRTAMSQSLLLYPRARASKSLALVLHQCHSIATDSNANGCLSKWRFTRIVVCIGTGRSCGLFKVAGTTSLDNVDPRPGRQGWAATRP